MQKEKQDSKKAYFITHGAVLAVLLVICILANVLTAKWDSVLTDFFGTVGGTQTSAQQGDYISEFDSDEALREAQLEHTRRVAAEGVVLLRNEDSFLPLKAGAQLSVFGLASASGVTSGSGSGESTRNSTASRRPAVINTAPALAPAAATPWANGKWTKFLTANTPTR